MNINQAAYWHDSFSFTDDEIRFSKEFEDWLPHQIFDAHAHASLPEHMMDSTDDSFFSRPASTFPSFSIDESLNCHRIFYPGKNVTSLRFGYPFPCYDIRQENTYLLDGTEKRDKIAVVGLSEDLDYTRDLLEIDIVKAIKIYPLQKIEVATTINEFFTDGILEMAQNANKPIILHLPKPIWETIDELETICARFPKLTIVLAHMGLSYLYDSRFKKAVQRLRPLKNVYLDTAMVISKEPITTVIQEIGFGRIVYGSDEPLCYARWIEVNLLHKGTWSVPKYPYHWTGQIIWKKYKEQTKNASHNHWKVLDAIKGAIETLPLNEQDIAKKMIFYGNANKLFLQS